MSPANRALLRVVAIVLACLALPSVRAAIIVTNTGDQTITEGQTTTVTFWVDNQNDYAMVLDFALCTIVNSGPDLSDWVHFAGPNGNAGLTTAALLFPAHSGPLPFTYSLITDSPDYGPPADGWSYIDFEIELSPAGDQGAYNPAIYDLLMSLFGANPPEITPGVPFLGPGQLLYANGEQGDPTPSSLIVTVNDVPEPSFAIPSLLALGLVGFSARKRSAGRL